MSDYSAIKAAIEGLTGAHRQNALDLVERMESTIEGIGDRERGWAPPFLKLIQPTTGDVPDGASAGSLVVGDEVLLKKKGDALTLIPLRVWDSRQYWDPDPNNAQQLCNSPDAKTGYTYGNCFQCPYGKWVDDKPAPCGKSKSFLAITSDFAHIVQINFAKSNFKFGKDWEGLLKRASVSPYRRAYAMTTEKAAKAPTYNMKVAPADVRPEPEHLDFLQALFAKIGDDRKAMLDNFYEGVAARKERKALAGPSEDTVEDEAINVIETDADEGESEVDSGAKGYAL